MCPHTLIAHVLEKQNKTTSPMPLFSLFLQSKNRLRKLFLMKFQLHYLLLCTWAILLLPGTRVEVGRRRAEVSPSTSSSWGSISGSQASQQAPLSTGPPRPPKHRVLTGFFPVSCPREPSGDLCGHAAFFLASLQLKSSQLTTSYLSALFLATSVPGGVFIYLFFKQCFLKHGIHLSSFAGE